MNTKLFLFDVETGGLNENETPLLTLFGVVLDENLKETASISLAIGSESGFYNLDVEAMRINKIDIVQHHEKAIPEEEARQLLSGFLEFHAGSGKLLPAGHNLDLDIRYLRKFLGEKTFRRCLDKHKLDTATIGLFLQKIGKIPSDVRCSLAAYCEHFGIVNRGVHEAEGDTRATQELLCAMVAVGAKI